MNDEFGCLAEETGTCTCLDPGDSLPVVEHGAWLVWVAVVMAIGALVGYVLLATGGFS